MGDIATVLAQQLETASSTVWVQTQKLLQYILISTWLCTHCLTSCGLAVHLQCLFWELTFSLNLLPPMLGMAWLMFKGQR